MQLLAEMLYMVKTPWWVIKWIYPAYTWSMPATRDRKTLYLTFDDGPHPAATTFVLDELKKYNAKATFFCVGKNVPAHPAIYQRIIDEGHAVGNHTQNHMNGWKTEDAVYFNNITTAAKYIDSNLFRPPYGRITRFQARHAKERLGLQVIMWSVLSGDFDPRLQPEDCWKNVRKSAQNGSIIVFHDSENAMDRMAYSLTKVLEYFSAKGFVFDKITL
jgi:peptidoglycan-N-acetylglucosamine deacetylase